MSVWVLTDGKAGDELQCLGVAEELTSSPVIHRIHPRAPWYWFTPYGPIDPKDRPDRPSSPLAPPYPDCVIASGRRAVPYLRAIRTLSPSTFTVFLKDPKTGAGTADLIWVPDHDRLRGKNVITTITPPHRMTGSRLERARREKDPRLARLGHPLAAVLVGGKSRHHDFSQEDIRHFVSRLESLIGNGVHLAITTSRRTPAELDEALKQLVATHPGHFLWDGSGENPYAAMLALSDAIVATADSFNMIGEAAATGTPVFVFDPSGGHPKLTAFIEALRRYGAVHPLTERLEAAPYKPLDATQFIADRIKQEMARKNRLPAASL